MLEPNQIPMELSPRFCIFVLFSPERGPETLHEPLTFVDEALARKTATSFPMGKVVLRKDTVTFGGAILHEIVDLDVPAVVGTLFVPSTPLVPYGSPLNAAGDAEKELFVGKALGSDRHQVIQHIIDAMCEDADCMLSPEEFFPNGPFGHLGRDLTYQEKLVLASFQEAQDELASKWLSENMVKMSDDQIAKTIAFHADKDLGPTFWRSLQERLAQ